METVKIPQSLIGSAIEAELCRINRMFVESLNTGMGEAKRNAEYEEAVKMNADIDSGKA